MIYKDEKCDTLKRKAIDARRFIEKEWYINTLFIQGKHYVVYDTNTRALKRVERSQGQVQRVVNNTKRFRDVMVRLIGRDEPRVEIKYTGFDKIDDSVREKVDLVDHLVKEKWRTRQLDYMTISSVKESISKGITATEIYWDKDARKGLGDCGWKKIDMWELYFDPQGKLDFQSGEFDGDYMLRSVMTTTEALKLNPKYDNRLIDVAVSSQDENDVKRNLDNILYENSASQPEDSVILDIWYIRERSYEKIEGENGYKLVEKFKIKEKLGNTTINEYDTDLAEYPIKLMKAEVEETLLTRPPLSDQIDPNKTVDQVYSSMEEYARTMLHGRILRHKKTKISQISKKSGQIVTYDGNREPRELRMGGIDGSLFSLAEKAELIQQNMAKVSDGTLGTGNATSGLELGLRKASDLENSSEPAMVLGKYIALIIKTMLKLYSKHLATTMPITYGKTGEEKIKKAIGADYANDKNYKTPKGAIPIEYFDDIEVKIVPKSAFSDLALQQDIMQLAQMGAVDRETVVETFMKGRTREVLGRIKRAEAEANGINGEVVDAEAEAQAENEAIMNGKTPKEGTAFKSKQAQQAGISKNAEFLQGLIESKSSPELKNKAIKLIQDKAKRYGIPMR